MVYWAELAQEFSVPNCDSARSVNLDRILVVLTAVPQRYFPCCPTCWDEVLSDSARGRSPLPRVVGVVSCAPPMIQLCGRGVYAGLPLLLSVYHAKSHAVCISRE